MAGKDGNVDLGEMHDKLARVLTKSLDGVTKLDKDGNLVTVDPSPSDKNVVRQFLKDNGVTSLRDANEPMNDLIRKAREKGLRLTGDGDDSGFGSGRQKIA